MHTIDNTILGNIPKSTKKIPAPASISGKEHCASVLMPHWFFQAGVPQGAHFVREWGALLHWALRARTDKVI